MHINNIPNVIAAACILHNMCEIHGKYFNETWLQEIEADTNTNSSQPSNVICS